MLHRASRKSRRHPSWRLALGLFVLAPFQINGSQQSTAVYPDNPTLSGGLVCVSDDGVTCLEPDGLGKRWAALIDINTFEPLLARDTVLVGSTDGLHALDRADGSRRWQWRAGEQVFSPAVEAGVVYAADRSGRIAALDLRDGREIWEQQFEGWLYTPALVAGRVITGGSGGVVYALHRATGEILWARQVDQELVFRPVAAAGGVVVTTFKGSALLLDGDGEVVWQQHDPAPSFSPAASERLLVFGGMDGVLRAREPRTGRLRWRVRFSGLIDVPARLHAGEVAIVRPGGSLVILDAVDGSRQARFAVPGTSLGRPVYSPERGWQMLQRNAGIFSWVGASEQ